MVRIKRNGIVVLQLLKHFVVLLLSPRGKNRQKQPHKSPYPPDCSDTVWYRECRDCGHVGVTIRTRKLSLVLLSCYGWVEGSAERLVKLGQNLDQ